MAASPLDEVSVGLAPPRSTSSTAISLVLKIDDRGRAVLSPAEACEALGIGLSALYALMKGDKLPFLHIGGRTKIAVSDIAAYIAREREGATMRRMPWDREKPAQRKHWPRRRKPAISEALNK